jgi:hypothetical protein
MEICSPSRPEHGEITIGTTLYKSSDLAIGNTFNVRIGRQKLPTTVVSDIHSAAAKQSRATLLAVQELQNSMLVRAVVAENPRVREQLTSSATVVSLARRAPWSCASPKSFDIPEEPVQPKGRQRAIQRIAEGAREQQTPYSQRSFTVVDIRAE